MLRGLVINPRILAKSVFAVVVAQSASLRAFALSRPNRPGGVGCGGTFRICLARHGTLVRSLGAVAGCTLLAGTESAIVTLTLENVNLRFVSS